MPGHRTHLGGAAPLIARTRGREAQTPMDSLVTAVPSRCLREECDSPALIWVYGGLLLLVLVVWGWWRYRLRQLDKAGRRAQTERHDAGTPCE